MAKKKSIGSVQVQFCKGTSRGENPNPTIKHAKVGGVSLKTTDKFMQRLGLSGGGKSMFD